ncbi:GMC family oxidoreductase [Shewanella sp. YLB-07]|uniref:GMC family oxidoreductase n=1 Tax=Shewanella sp. YLB-07 TaxID=2601268 RepID=UPI00128D9199|nr:GMC family oxidoreductase [Shewanella sp. YLB-07]MPY24571.1 GMC family oxidoreductase [Shewanella sp. YLB-07]
MKKTEYDVIVVGSGIAGAVLCKTLTQAGKQVLLLEAGLAAGMALDGEQDHLNYQSYLERFYADGLKATNTPYPTLKDAPSINVLEIEAKTPYDGDYLVQKGPLPFASDCLRAPGGTTLHWLGNVPRMLPNDFKMNTRYGRGVDWPMTYEDLRPYYEMAENEIGVAGEVTAQQGPDMGIANYGEDYVFPMQAIPQSYQDQLWIKHTEDLMVELNGTQYPLSCISMPQGRNGDPCVDYRYGTTVWNDKLQALVLTDNALRYEVVGATWAPNTGARCEGNASCVPICPVQAKYNALKTLKKSDFSLLDIRTQSVASLLEIDPDTQAVSAVVYKVYHDPSGSEYVTKRAQAKVIVLACSAIENAKLLLASKAANSSDQVGRNLMDHQVLLTWGLLPEKGYPYRGPGCTTYIPTFRDGPFRQDHAAWISPIDNWGWSWPTFAPGSDVVNAVVEQQMFGQPLRHHLSDVVPRQALLHFECEQAPSADNRVTIDKDYLDQLGNCRPVIEYHCDEYMRKSFEAAKKVSDQIFAANHIEDRTLYKPTEADYVEYNGHGYTFRGAGHIVGTHRMGTCADNSVVDSEQRTWDHPNLFLAGCGNMPTLGTSNPTLTMTALTFAAAESILKQLNKR